MKKLLLTLLVGLPAAMMADLSSDAEHLAEAAKHVAEDAEHDAKHVVEDAEHAVNAVGRFFSDLF